MKLKTIDAARGKWKEILRRLGLDERYLQNRHTDCPLCRDGKDRYRFDDKDGKGTFYCNTCGAGDGMDLAVKFTGLDFKEVARQIDAMVGNIEPEQPKPKGNPSNRINKILAETRSLGDDDPVTRYLRARRLPKSGLLTQHPALTYYDNRQIVGRFPAMVTPLVSPDGQLVTLHVTYLSEEGGKADVESVKKILPPIGETAGAAIRLTRIHPHMGIAEGIETALAVMKIFNIPCWASANAGLLEKFVPPAGVERVTVFADNDTSYTGQKAAHVLAHRLALQGMPVDVKIPHVPGTDFADEIEQKHVA